MLVINLSSLFVNIVNMKHLRKKLHVVEVSKTCKHNCDNVNKFNDNKFNDINLMTSSSKCELWVVMDSVKVPLLNTLLVMAVYF